MTTQPDEVARLAARLDELDAGLARVAADVTDLAAAVVHATHADAHFAADHVAAPAYETLDSWVEEYFTVVFSRPIGGEIRWCPQWREHPEAVTRLEALWRSWETLRLEPNLGMASWLTGCLDPQQPIFLGRSGPFAQCSVDRHLPGAIWPSYAR